jgi:RHS repeat-associated protein
MTLKVDDFGNVERSVAIAYPRRAVPDRQPEQEETHITLTVNSFINSPELPIKFPQLYSPEDMDWYRASLPVETQTYEIVKPPEPEVSATSVALLTLEDIRNITEGLFGLDQDEPDTLKTLSYEKWNWRKDTSTPNETKLRLIERVRTLYRKNDLTGFLPLGQLDSLALPYESYKLALTPGLVTQVFDGKVSDAIITNEGRYVHTEGDSNWWIPSGHIFYSPNKNDTPSQELAFAQQHFFLPHRFQDPFDQVTTISYDNYDLLMLESEDPLHNKVTAGERDAQGSITNKNDYRMLQPVLITDPNGNRSAVVFDALGMMVGTAVMGKSRENKGDSLTSFEPDLDEATILTHIQNPLANPHGILQKATTRLVYDLYAYHRTRDDPQPQPAVVYTLAREIHDADLAPGQLAKIQHSFSYSDGFSRENQKKIQAEPGDVDGIPTDPRWVGSGWTIYNNKGKPVKQYEPFFSTTHQFEFVKIVGVSSTLFYDPLERVIATLHPNNTYEKVVFNPWRQETWDVNDTVLQGDPKNDPDVGDFFCRLPDTDYLPTWYEDRILGAMGSAEESAATKAAVHANTPSLAYLDSLGRTFLTIADNGPDGQYPTRVQLDIEGNTRLVTDARDNPVMEYAYSIVGLEEENEEENEDEEENEEQLDSHLIYQKSMDAGERWMLNDVIGNPIYNWDSRGHAFRTEYDALRRPMRAYVKGADPQDPDKEILFERTVYGENLPDSNSPTPGKLNLRDKVFMQLDGAGVIINVACNPQTDEDEAYDFKGNLLRTTRQLAREYKQHVDWSAVEPLLDTDLLNLPAIEAALAPLLEVETFMNSTTYDALNRPVTLTTSDNSIIRPAYNEANLLERVEVNLHGAATATTFVNDIDYNARGQREFNEYGNGVKTTYEYDDKTFKLIHLSTVRGTKRLQDLFYTYDPVGNITAIRDDAQQTIYFNGEVVRPDAEYIYDAIYRLIEATGREHIGQASIPHTTWNDQGRVNLAHPNDGQKMRNYFEFYEYDEVGNIKRFNHYANSGSWIRNYIYEEPSLIETGQYNNRLSYTLVDHVTEPYTYDPHGNMTSMLLHLQQMEWDFEDQLHYVNKGSEEIYYVYDAAGQRVRKVVEKNNNGALIEERIYLGGFEVFRRSNGSGLKLERETLHIMDDQQRIALVETRTKGDDDSPEQLVRYQLGNHLGSASLELDEDARVISYEEYYPYGSTSYQAVDKEIKAAAKRYRYTGKERDEESGLYYHGARYYAPWLARWSSCDPAGDAPGLNLYRYVRNNPLTYNDPMGTEESSWEEAKQTWKHIKKSANAIYKLGKGIKRGAQSAGQDVGKAIEEIRHAFDNVNFELESRFGFHHKLSLGSIRADLDLKAAGNFAWRRMSGAALARVDLDIRYLSPFLSASTSTQALANIQLRQGMLDVSSEADISLSSSIGLSALLHGNVGLHYSPETGYDVSATGTGMIKQGPLPLSYFDAQLSYHSQSRQLRIYGTTYGLTAMSGPGPAKAEVPTRVNISQILYPDAMKTLPAVGLSRYTQTEAGYSFLTIGITSDFRQVYVGASLQGSF